MITKEDIKRGYYLSNGNIPVYKYHIVAVPIESGYYCLRWAKLDNNDFIRENGGELKRFGSRNQAYDYVRTEMAAAEISKAKIGYIIWM